jgi:hypothetical protein
MASMGRSVLYAPAESRAGMSNYKPTHHNRRVRSLQSHYYDQKPNSRHYAASDARAQARSWFYIP